MPSSNTEVSEVSYFGLRHKFLSTMKCAENRDEGTLLVIPTQPRVLAWTGARIAYLIIVYRLHCV